MADWDQLVLDAQRAGYTVSEEDGLWWITTPRMFRQPPATLGAYRNARAAWRGAALINSRFGANAREDLDEAAE